MGPLALVQARKVVGIAITNELSLEVEVRGEPKKVLTDLVKQYAVLFGNASVEVCRDAVKDMGGLVDKKDLPVILQ
jgi:hypothetical protein